MDAMGEGECLHPREFWGSSDSHYLYCGICGEDLAINREGRAVAAREDG